MSLPKTVSADFAQAVPLLYPSAAFTDYIVDDLGDGQFKLVYWNIDAPIPDQAAVLAAIAARDAAEPARLRQLAYRAESDGLAIRAQRLEWQGDAGAAAAKAEYFAKVAEIKLRHPDVVQG